MSDHYAETARTGDGGPKSVMRQVGWRSRTTGAICDCPVYERSPHANSDPVYVEVQTDGR